jgi:cytochrome c biogenesis protein
MRPKMLRDMRSWRDHVREESLRNFHHKTEWTAPLARAALASQTAERLGNAGYQVKLVDKERRHCWWRPRRAPANKFGYIFAHSAIIIILLGGLLDSDLPHPLPAMVHGQDALHGRRHDRRDSRPAPPRPGQPDLPRQHHDPGRAGSNVAIMPQANGVLMQELPFTIKLNKFIIDFYSTGMPKLFASEVTIRDHETGKTFPATIKVNQPLIYRGVASTSPASRMAAAS